MTFNKRVGASMEFKVPFAHDTSGNDYFFTPNRAWRPRAANYQIHKRGPNRKHFTNYVDALLDIYAFFDQGKTTSWRAENGSGLIVRDLRKMDIADIALYDNATVEDTLQHFEGVEPVDATTVVSMSTVKQESPTTEIVLSQKPVDGITTADCIGRIMDLAKSNGKTQAQIAEELEYTRPNICSMWRQGRTPIPLKEIPNFCKSAGVDPLELTWRAVWEYMPENAPVIFKYS